MPSRSFELAAAWLLKAQHDLEIARLLVRDQKRLLDVAVYHCQQTGEKSLKGFLTAREIPFPKTHALGELLNLCHDVVPQFEQFRIQAEILAPLAHRFRYPGDAMEPTMTEAEKALGAAEEIYQFCRERIVS